MVAPFILGGAIYLATAIGIYAATATYKQNQSENNTVDMAQNKMQIYYLVIIAALFYFGRKLK